MWPAIPGAVDVVLSRIMGIDPLSIATIRQCVERGLLPEDLSEVEIRGLELSEAIQKNFAVPPGKPMAFPAWTRPFMPIAKYLLTTRPRINKRRCIGCGDCERVCPVDMITMENGKARIHLSGCIRCYCCHETCAHHAIDLIHPSSSASSFNPGEDYSPLTKIRGWLLAGLERRSR